MFSLEVILVAILLLVQPYILLTLVFDEMIFLSFVIYDIFIIKIRSYKCFTRDRPDKTDWKLGSSAMALSNLLINIYYQGVLENSIYYLEANQDLFEGELLNNVVIKIYKIIIEFLLCKVIKYSASAFIAVSSNLSFPGIGFSFIFFYYQ